MKLAIMTKSTFFVEEDKILSSLFDEGLDDLHLFKPGSSPMYSERLLTLLPEDYYRKITVHDHFYLKQEYDLAGIHLDNPTDNLPDGYKGKFSRTCTDLSQLKEMKKKSQYVFLKNIFDCIEFKEEKSSFSLQQLELAAGNGLIDKKVYALGGMSLENIKIAKALGFGGVVICGDLWNRFDIHNEKDYKELIAHFEKLRKAVS
ncbi:MAG: thiamine phosphate synthase [Prevotella sp.]|jgi:thiamine-phosphate pyrophosphorylase|uniref:thiamine-phosphate pyrophosphorylase n=1 Tax=Prevotella sp. TaxID=59823 RepID=UPI0003357E9A|nr:MULTISPECIES: thiamine-phosphate pyrophosphorylase [unclassified Prevotella]MBD9299929.1 thiamine phosphate synthase [Prevotella sp.]MED9897015.1 thiamine phosphate synthase [Prevotella sp.]CDD21121.1 thiamine phosphate pyrophosphorylase [Prevotella sp. CAG:732]HRM57248.1 thiamine phosphate synthase [Prevotella sp.]